MLRHKLDDAVAAVVALVEELDQLDSAVLRNGELARARAMAALSQLRDLESQVPRPRPTARPRQPFIPPRSWLLSHPGATHHYGGHVVKETGDGWVALKDGASVIPGAARCETPEEALFCVDVMLAVSDADPAQRFHHLCHAILAATGKLQ